MLKSNAEYFHMYNDFILQFWEVIKRQNTEDFNSFNFTGVNEQFKELMYRSSLCFDNVPEFTIKECLLYRKLLILKTQTIDFVNSYLAAFKRIATTNNEEDIKEIRKISQEGIDISWENFLELQKEIDNFREK